MRNGVPPSLAKQLKAAPVIERGFIITLFVIENGITHRFSKILRNHSGLSDAIWIYLNESRDRN
jgi:hypothetical protein